MKKTLLCLVAAVVEWREEIRNENTGMRATFETFAFIAGGLFAALVPIIIVTHNTSPNQWGFAALCFLWILSYIIFNLIRRTYIRCRS